MNPTEVRDATEGGGGDAGVRDGEGEGDTAAGEPGPRPKTIARES